MWGNEKLSLCVRSDQVSHPHSQAVGFGGKRRENLGKFEAIREEEVQGQRFSVRRDIVRVRGDTVD